MAEKELELLDNVELRFALCENDSQLERTLGTFLTPVLLKLASPHEVVRKKVMDILAHINKRIKPNPQIKIPFDKLLAQFTDPNVSVFVKNFTIIYLDMGISRIKPEEAAACIPSLVQGIAQRPPSQRITIFHMILSALSQYKLSATEELTARSEIFHFDKNPQDAAAILSFFLDVLLYTSQSPSQSQLQAQAQAQANAEAAPSFIPPGLSPKALANVTKSGKHVWAESALTRAKIAILKFLCTPVFVDNERLRHLIVGSVDLDHQIVSIAEDGLRKWCTKVDLEDPTVVNGLFGLYLGTPQGVANVDVQDRRKPSTVPVKLKIFAYLCRSKLAASTIPAMLQVMFDSLYGEGSNPRLKQIGLSFVQWVGRMGDAGKLATVASVILSGLLKFINESADQALGTGYDAETTIGYAYASIGLLAKKVPSLLRNDISILTLFFTNLSTSSTNVRTYIQDALSSMIVVYNEPEKSPGLNETLQTLLLSSIQKDASSRYIALKYVNALYPFSSVFARYICLLGLNESGGKLEVREEAKRGLHPFILEENTFAINKTNIPPNAFPDFVEMVDWCRSRSLDLATFDTSKSKVVTRGYPVEIYIEMLRFLKLTLVVKANENDIVIDDRLEDRVEDGMSENPAMRKRFGELIMQWWRDGGSQKVALEKYLEIIEGGIKQDVQDQVLHSVASTCLLELISLGPSAVSNAFTTRLEWIRTFLSSPKPETRESMAHIFGIVGSSANTPIDELQEMLKEFVRTIEKPDTAGRISMAEEKHGAILAVGYLLGRIFFRGRVVDHLLTQECIRSLVAQLDQVQTVTNITNMIAACQALGEIARIVPLTSLLDDESKEQNQAKIDLTEAGVKGKGKEVLTEKDLSIITPETTLKKLATLAKTSKEPKLQEKAIQTLGYMSVPLSDNQLLEIITGALYETANTKQVELYFMAGEAFSNLVAGWNSESLVKCKDISDVPIPTTSSPELLEERDKLFQEIFNKIIGSYVSSDKATWKKASCIWLLCLTKFCKDLPILKNNLRQLHSAFSRLLNDRDDFTQECASKGLSLVYESGDSKIKEDLLFSLVGTFTDGQAPRQTVTADTVLFDQGQLGQTPDGSSITTYKELQSLASEMNQPDLIYKFMNLANHNAMWNSRRGAAFGFQSLMVHAEKELEPFLPKLIPKLYRYQFDPNPRVNQNMKMIWRALVKDPKKAVDTYFDEIIADLISGLGNRLWRIREASCLAVTDLLQGRQMSQLYPHLSELWKMCFRAIDDIKESVREAATATCRNLVKLTVHYCDASVVSPTDGAKVMNIVIPFLLEKGIVSDAKDVQKFSLETILRVCKTGAALLKPHIPNIVDTLLQSLSSLEPQSMNYLSFHTDKYGVTQEQLDNARLFGAKNSPMMEGIEYCIDQVDEDVMTELIPRIITLIRKGVGLPTKAGTARFIVTLCIKKRMFFEPHADIMLKALSGAVQDRNAAVRKSYATAVGYTCQLAPNTRLISFVNHLKKIYIENDDEEIRPISGITMSEMAKHATDKLKSIGTEVMPLVYFGTHNVDEAERDTWKDAWDNLTPSSSSSVTIFMQEIVAFINPLLSSPSWKIKQTAALTMADLCKTLGSNLREQITIILPLLTTALNTRTWTGKESVLDAFCQLCVSCKDWFLKNPNTEPGLDGIAKIFVREAARNNKPYRRHALGSLTTFLESFNDVIDKFSDDHEFLFEICEWNEADVMDEGEDNEKPLVLLIKAAAFKAVVAGWRPDLWQDQVQYLEPLTKLLTSHIQGNVWNIQLSILTSLETFVSRTPVQLLNKQIFDKIVATLMVSLGDMKYSAIRTAAMKDLVVLMAKVKGTSLIDTETKVNIAARLDEYIAREVVAALVDDAKKIKESLSN